MTYLSLFVFAVSLGAHAASMPEHADDRLTQSACNGDLERVRKYLRAGDKPTDKSLFCASAMSFNLEMTDLLLTHGANPNANYAYMNPLTGYTFHMSMLEFAVHSSRTDIAQTLINGGADINLPFQVIAQNSVEYAVTALSLAASRGNELVVKYLLELKADVNASSAAALFAVVTRPSLPRADELLKLLLDAGGDPRIRNAEGRTICDYAVGIQLDSILAAGGCQ